MSGQSDFVEPERISLGPLGPQERNSLGSFVVRAIERFERLERIERIALGGVCSLRAPTLLQMTSCVSILGFD